MLAQNLAAAVPAGYYDSLEGKSGVELKQAVKALAADHVRLNYGEDQQANPSFGVEFRYGTWTVFAESDVREIDNHLCWWDMYSPFNVWVADGHPGLNIEHSVANSWWGGKTGSQLAYNDLHHLNPSNGDANGQKSNWPLGEIQGNPYWTNGVTTTGTPKTGYGDGASRVFEPHDIYKGDFARAYFYIFTIYDDIPWKDDYNWMYNTSSGLLLKKWASDLLLKWAAEDPVSEKEVVRNDAVYKYQENRNPFIDCPQLADHIWGSKQNEPFHYTLYTPQEDDPTSYPGWDEEFEEMRKGQWVPVTSIEELDEDTKYFIVSPTKNRAMTYTLISTNKAIDECTTSPLHELSTYPEVLTAVPQEIATVKLEKDGDFWYVGVYDPEDEFIGYINVTAKNNATFSKSKVQTCRTTLSYDGEKNSILIFYTLSDSMYWLQYNSGNPRFAAYSSNQNPIQLYRESEEELKDPENAGIGGTGLDENAAEEILGIYDLNGRLMNAASTRDLGKGIYIVVSNKGARKVVR